MNADGSLDTNFNTGFGSGPDDAVHALAIQAGAQVLVGGSFTNFNATAANRIARLNTDGTLDTNFVAAVGVGANNVVEGIAVQPDDRIVLVGQFTQANGRDPQSHHPVAADGRAGSHHQFWQWAPMATCGGV